MAREPFPLQWPAGWPRAGEHQRSNFRVLSFARCRDGVIAQLIRMGATNGVITSDLPARLDGLPYATSLDPDDPGVAVWWVKGGREQVIACDRWDRTRDNLRAIELSLEALRGLDRWGSSEIVSRALAGFAALPPAPEGEPDWRAVLGPWVQSLEQARARYRELARQLHPDHGGSTEGMQRLVAAFAAAEQELAR